ncbi:MAG: hypothetical protein CME64_00225 [Halobacteriovoraceae bacterium]|nr:hypothetical protein [Halobacteriovoraceae bacterium]
MELLQARDRIEQFFEEIQTSFEGHYKDALHSCGIETPVHGHSNLPASTIMNILNCFNVSLYKVAKGDVDYEVMEKQLRGEQAIPSRYFEGALYSLKSTPVNIINCISNSLSRDAANEVVKTVQIKGIEAQESDENVNLILLHDICDYLQTFYGKDLVASIGAQKAQQTIGQKVDKWRGKIKCLKTLMELFIDEVYPKTVGQNFNWKLQSVDENSFVIGGAPRPEVERTFKNAGLVPRSLEVLRKGYLQTLPSVIGHRTLAIHQISSISHGEKSDTYKIVSAVQKPF